MTITLNGEKKTLDAEVTVADLIRASGQTGNGVAVAVNMAFVPRSTHATTIVHDGDNVEIVEPRQGG
ncbi:MAG TPA: sulfur carrier protein ThiS [Kiritimatiellia bacterium]|jgi:sulfur carrier protein